MLDNRHSLLYIDFKLLKTVLGKKKCSIQLWNHYGDVQKLCLESFCRYSLSKSIN